MSFRPFLNDRAGRVRPLFQCVDRWRPKVSTFCWRALTTIYSLRTGRAGRSAGRLLDTKTCRQYSFPYNSERPLSIRGPLRNGSTNTYLITTWCTYMRSLITPALPLRMHVVRKLFHTLFVL